MAGGVAGSGGGRALSDHVIRGAMDLWRAGPERRTRRFQVARAGRARRSQNHRRPGRNYTIRPAPARSSVAGSSGVPRLASSALKRHITATSDPCMAKYFLAVLILLSACISGPARAEDAAAPFDGDLQRLAEILGTLHYLRGICGANEGGKWRNEMQALIDAETPSGDRRARMIAGFNRGYNGFQQTYRTCTPAATVAIRRYIEEGSRISRDLTARYANYGPNQSSRRES